MIASLDLSAANTDVDTALLRFDSVQSVSNANHFFSVLLEQGFIDDTICFDRNSSPADINFQVWYWGAEWYNDSQQYKTAYEYATKALQLCNDDNTTKADLLSLLAIINIRLGHCDEAARYAKECYEIDIQEGNPDHISSSLNTIAAIYIMTRQLDEAEKYILESERYAKQTGNLGKVALVKGTASEIYHRMGEYEKSLKYATEAYELEVSLSNNAKAAIRQSQRASALISLGRYEEAESALNEAIPEFRADGNLHSLAIVCNQMGILMHTQGNDTAAVEYYKEALEIFTAQNDLFNQCQTHKGLHDALRNIDVNKALYHGDCYNQLRDSLYDSETGMLLSKYAAEYDNYHLQLQNDDLRQKSRKRIILLLTILVALIILVVTIFFVSKKYQQRRLENLFREIELLQAQINNKEETEGETPIPDNKPVAEETKSSLKEDDKQFLAQVVQAVNEAKEGTSYSVETVASYFNMTPQTFRRRIFGLTGQLPNAFINAIRMQKAGQLLKDNKNLSISDIAQECGYDEISTFSRSFKRYYEVSPSDFRRQNQE